MTKLIDVRSDTVTRPSEHMRSVMMNAAVGDDVYADDPSTNEFQEFAADLLGHESSMFLPTGTQSNLVALLTHCQRGDEYIVGADAHTYKYEGGGAAVLGGIQPQTLEFGDNGELDLAKVKNLIKEDDFHFARTRLLSLENTQHGRVQSVEYMKSAQQFAKEHSLKIHLDGARMANAAVALGVELKAIGECFDTVSLCLSKGLGAPIGSLLFGPKSFIDEARRWRKVTGGGMRQVGMLAAAGKLALTAGFERMHLDHENANYLAAQMEGVPGVSVKEGWTQTNMVWLEFDEACGEALSADARAANVLMSAYGRSCRVVTHHDVDKADMDRLVMVVRTFFDKNS
ncbi:low-specificity L-threonine aldolase [Granulosicoccus sp.]|nr:low-specificity L-threonine aldolase [Granulosicoccus sp.]MDB4224035.1 low-specificity L-threonine aldolase [Granulosicoccus sp.]